MSAQPPRIGARLEADHRELDELWERFQNVPASDGPTRRERFAGFRSHLLRHIAVEEERLFPRLEEDAPRHRALVARLREEHREIEALLERIDRALVERSERANDLGVELINVLGEHNAREEGSAYPWLNEHFDPDEARSIEQRLSETLPE